MGQSSTCSICVPKMRCFVGLTLILLALAASEASHLKAKVKGVKAREWTTASCDGVNSSGDKCCRMGQGDCDWDSDCCDGLKCGFDWGLATDYCVSGPTTQNYTWTDWTQWSDCSVSCGGSGVMTRTRDCIGPVDGGMECPTPDQTETQSCDAPACWTEFGEWSVCQGMCGSPGSQTRSRSCMEPEEGGEACPEESTETETQECDLTGFMAMVAPSARKAYTTMGYPSTSGDYTTMDYPTTGDYTTMGFPSTGGDYTTNDYPTTGGDYTSTGDYSTMDYPSTGDYTTMDYPSTGDYTTMGYPSTGGEYTTMDYPSTGDHTTMDYPSTGDYTTMD